MIATVLGEYRRGPRSATIEVLRKDGIINGYRVTTACRYPTITAARKAYLQFVPENKRKCYERLLREAHKNDETNNKV